MRYAIVSDLHANEQAWNAALVDAESIGVDAFICLGDVVGYGPSPAATLASARESVQHFVAGNHDAAVAGLLDPACFNREAQQSVDWTARQLNKAALGFLEELPLMLKGERFRCVHANAVRPELFDYVFQPDEALASWEQIEEQLLFIGHTHCPGIFVVGGSGTPHELSPQDFELEENKRYIVNTGSVGLPRDGDRRASYCVYDDELLSVWFRRIPFDINVYFGLFEKGTCPVTNPSYLHPLRPAYNGGSISPRMDFNPPAAGTQPQVNPCDVLNIEAAIRERAKVALRWKLIAAVCAVMLGALVASWIWLAPGSGSHGLYVASEYQQENGNHLTLPVVGGSRTLDINVSEDPVDKKNPLARWSVYMDAPENQWVASRSLEAEDSAQKGTRVLELKSEGTERLLLLSCPFQATAGSRLRITASFKRRSWEKGAVKLALFRNLPEDARISVIDVEPPGLRDEKNHWCFASETMKEAFSEDAVVQVGIKGRFEGKVIVRSIRLHRQKKL